MSQYLDFIETCATARVSASTLARRLRNGEGPRKTRLGRRVLFASTDVDAWLSSLPTS